MRICEPAAATAEEVEVGVARATDAREKRILEATTSFMIVKNSTAHFVEPFI